MLAIYISALPDPSDESKFEKFYYEYKQILLKVCHDHIHDAHLAEDCTHEIFLYIAEHFDKIGDIRSKATNGYVLTIARAYACRFYNQTISEDYLEDLNCTDELDDGIDYAELAHSDIDISIITECIEQMKDPYREVLILRSFHDLPFDEIATILDTSEGNVRKILERARKKLLKALKVRKTDLAGDLEW